MVHNEDAKTTASAADKARWVRFMFVSVSRQPLRRLREHARKYATRIITYGDGDGGRIAGESGENIENEAKVGLGDGADDSFGRKASLQPRPPASFGRAAPEYAPSPEKTACYLPARTSSSAISRSLNFCTFMDGVIGKSSTKNTRLGTL